MFPFGIVGGSQSACIERGLSELRRMLLGAFPGPKIVFCQIYIVILAILHRLLLPKLAMLLIFHQRQTLWKKVSSSKQGQCTTACHVQQKLDIIVDSDNR